jgi:hypothetical protein
MEKLKTYKQFIKESSDFDSQETYTGHFVVYDNKGDIISDFKDTCIASSEEEAETILLGRNGTFSKGQNRVVKLSRIVKESPFLDEGNSIDELEFAKTIGNKNVYENLDSLFNKLSDPKTPSIIRKTIVPDISEFRTEILDFARENNISADNMDWLIAEIKVRSRKTGVPTELYVACFKSLLSELEDFNIAALESLVPEDSIFLTVNPDKETVDKMYDIMKAFVSGTFSKINLIGLLQGNMAVAMKQSGDLKGI